MSIVHIVRSWRDEDIGTALCGLQTEAVTTIQRLQHFYEFRSEKLRRCRSCVSAAEALRLVGRAR